MPTYTDSGGTVFSTPEAAAASSAGRAADNATYRSAHPGTVLAPATDPTTATITAASLTPQTPYVPPTPAPASGLGTRAMTGLGAQNSVYQTANATLAATAAAQDKATGSTSGTDSLNNMMAMAGLIPKREDVMSSPEVTAAHDAQVAAQNQTNQDTALLNEIVKKQNQDLLTTRGTASANGVTEAVYGGQANEINREAAIQSLPIAAKIAIDQGNLKLAQDNLTYMTSVVQEKVNNAYDYASNIYNSINAYVTKSEAVTLDALKTKAANNFTLQQNAVSQAAEYAKLAVANGQGAIAQGLMTAQNTIGSLSTTSPTYAADLKSAQATVAALSGQIKGKQSSQIIGSADTGYTNVVTDAQGNVISSTPVTGGGADTGTGTQSTYGSIAQEAINAGASPQQALDEAINMAATRGNTMTIAQQNALYAKIIKMKAVTAPTTTGATTPTATPTVPLTGIEKDIATLKARYPYNTTELKQQLLNMGYPIKQITESSAGSLGDRASSFIHSLFGGK